MGQPKGFVSQERICCLQEFHYARIYGTAFVGDAGAGQDFVCHVDAEFTLLRDEAEEVEDVACIESAGICGAFGGQV